MTTIFSDGFESNDFSAWTGTEGSPTVQGTTKHTGSYAAQFTTATRKTCYKTIGSLTDAYAREYVYLESLPTSGNLISLLEFSGGDGSNLDICVGIKNWAGTQKWGITWDNQSTSESTYFAASPNPIANTWYCLELHVNKTAGTWEFYVNGTSLKSGSCFKSSVNIDQCTTGGYDKTDSITNYTDCAVIADAYIGVEGGAAAGQPYISRVQGIDGMRTWRGGF